MPTTASPRSAWICAGGSAAAGAATASTITTADFTSRIVSRANWEQMSTADEIAALAGAGQRPLRTVRRPLRRRDADPRARRARGAWAPPARDPAYRAELDALLADYVGRPSPLVSRAPRCSRRTSAARASTSSARTSATPARTRSTTASARCCSRGAWARRASSPRPAPASTASPPRRSRALFGLPCEVYMGAEDVERQALNVVPHEAAGRAGPRRSTSGTRTLKDAMNEALRDWVTNVGDTHYVIGSVAGPHPYPTLVRDLQAVIGREARTQIQEAKGACPTRCVACVGGGSNAMGLFHAVRRRREVGSSASRRRATASTPAATRRRSRAGRVGVLHGARATCCATPDGQIAQAHSISRRPRLSRRRPRARVLEGDRAARSTRRVTDDGGARRRSSASRAPKASCARSRARTRSRRCRGRASLPAAPSSSSTLSGRGDKDMGTIAPRRGDAVSRLARSLRARAGEQRAALVIYLTSGDPDPTDADRRSSRPRAARAPTSSRSACRGAIRRADGQAIQARCSARSRRGGGMPQVARAVAELRRRRTRPGHRAVRLLQPDRRHGRRRRSPRAAREAGADGVLCVDSAADEDAELTTALARARARPHPAARADVDAGAHRRRGEARARRSSTTCR